MITPSSRVYFLNVPFSPSQNNVLKFDSVLAQTTYMESKSVDTMTNCKYIREGDGEFLRVQKVADALYNCNYVMFQNTQFGEKWFYAFIEKIKYLNGTMSDLLLKLDVYQTFQFDYELKDCFIERQTFSVDSYNTLVDTPSTGDLKVSWEYEKSLTGRYFILFNADPTMDDSSNSIAHYPTIGTYSMPCYMAICQTASELSDIVQAVSNKGRADRIQACYYAPCGIDIAGYVIELLPKGDLLIQNNNINLINNMSIDLLSETITIDIAYAPTFKKELSYPYAKLEIVDRITARYIELDLSKFADPLHPQFKLMYNITNSNEYKVIPLNYNGIAYSIENSLVVEPSTDMPIFSNSYSKYLRDNKGSNIINGVMTVAGMAGSIATGNIAGAVGSFGNIASIINADNVARKQPNQVSGIKGDTFDYMNYAPSIYFRLKTMDASHMEIARKFWSSYGYPERRITSFNNTSNKFNFIKTNGTNIIADTIPSEYLTELENIFNNGVTIWNRNYLDYNIA